ncbi:MAG: heme-binding protein [Acidimicrobiales bacterium]
MSEFTYEQATAIVAAVLDAGHRYDLNPLTVAVLDAGGHLVAFGREDRSGILRPEIAIGKAWGSLGMGIPSRRIRDLLADRPTFVDSLSVASGGRFIPVPGGVLIVGESGVLGAVGVSGDTSDKDEACAIEAVNAVGLSSAPSKPAEGWQESGR